MKVNIAVTPKNSVDWERVAEAAYERPMVTPDAVEVDHALALGDLAEPLGFDGIWSPEHFGTPYSLSPSSLQVLSYFAGRTERVSLGTMVVVLPWWHPVRLAHQIAYLDIISKGRYDTIGLGRGVSKFEFDPLGIPREESRLRFEECLDVLELALSRERFSYDGQIFKIPETSIRPRPRTPDLASRFYGASATNTSLEIMSRRGLKPLFVGNKPLDDAARDVALCNAYRREAGLGPCQPKNILFMYCSSSREALRPSEEYIAAANRDVSMHYGFADPSSFVGVKGYEAYAAAQSAATAVTAAPNAKKPSVGSDSTYDRSNLLVGTPDEIVERIAVGQRRCSFSEITIVPQFGTMPFDEAEKSLRLFAREVLPEVHRMAAPPHPSILPEHAFFDAAE